MGDVIDISRFFRNCENCQFHDGYACRVPGGWSWDMKRNRCADFKRKVVLK